MPNLRRIRTEKGFTIKYVADSLKIPRLSYERYERGEQIPNALRAIRIADFLGADIRTLWEDELLNGRC